MLFNLLLSLVILPDYFKSIDNVPAFLNLENQPLILTAYNVLHPQIWEKELPERTYSDSLDMDISSRNALIVDAKTGKILYEKKSSEVVPIASMTKLMTAMVILDEQVNWEEQVKLIKGDYLEGGIHHLNIGETVTARDLWNSSLIASDNDATRALVRLTGLAYGDFIAKMNEKAKSLGLNNTIFYDAIGLEENVSTASEVLMMLRASLKYPEITNTTAKSAYEFKTLDKKNRLVKIESSDLLTKNSYVNIIGGKTGYNEEALYCVAAKLNAANGRELYGVVLGSETILSRFSDLKALVYWVTNNYLWP